MQDVGSSPIDSSRLIIILAIAVICVMGITYALNGTTSAEPVENNTTEQPLQVETTQKTVVGNSTLGTVTKISGYGNASSDIRVALVVGVNQKPQTGGAVVPTLENAKDLKYAYDIYVIESTNDNQAIDNSNSSSNLTANNKTQSLAYEYAVPDIINNNYNFTMDIHGVNDSNSFIFVPSEDTFTSKKAVSSISNDTGVGIYTPNYYPYAKSVSIPLIDNNIPSMVYCSNEYYSNETSAEISEVIHALDNFDFINLMENSSADPNNQSDNQSDSQIDNQLDSQNSYNKTSNVANSYNSTKTSNNSSSYYKNNNSTSGY